MKKNQIFKIFVCMVISIFYISIVKADSGEWNYDSEESYKNPTFLRNSDPVKWNSKFVDWNNPFIYQNPNVYSRQDIYKTAEVYKNIGFYTYLPDDKYRALEYKLVNYELIDHTKVNSEKYMADLGCKSCILREESANKNSLLRFSSQGISHQKGAYVSIPGTYPQSTLFVTTSDGITVKVPESNKRIEIPYSDSIVFSSNSDKFLIYGKEQIELNSGELTLKNGELFVKKTDSAIINGVRVEPKFTDVKIFSDGLEHKDCACTYVSMNKDKKVLISESNEKSSHKISFMPFNTFITIQAPLSITQDFGTIIVKNRDKEGLIPVITMKFDPNQKFEGLNSIFNGIIFINTFGDGRTKQTLKGTFDEFHQLNSNPLVLSIENLQGKSVLGTAENPKKLIMDSDNRITSISYRGASNLEREGLYFNIQEDVRITAERAKEAIKVQSKLKEEITKNWEVAPMLIFGWLDEPKKEGRIIEALKYTSENSGLSPYFLTAAAFNEGLNEHIELGYYENQNKEISGKGFLGLDYFGSESDELKRRGFLRKDFREYESNYLINEKGEQTTSANFQNINYGLEAFAAALSKRRADFLNDAKNLGYDLKTLGENQINYWTYLYYNCGEGCGRDRIKRNGLDLPKNPGTQGIGTNPSRDPNYNSKRVLATTELIKKAGLFEKKMSEQIK